MPTINIKTPLAANASVNVMTDSVFELIQEPSSVSIGVAADATGVLATIQSGGDVLLEEGPVSVKTINILPVFPGLTGSNPRPMPGGSRCASRPTVPRR